MNNIVPLHTCYSVGNEFFYDDLEVALGDKSDYNVGAEIRIGDKVDLDINEFVDVEDILDAAAEHAFDECRECAESWLYDITQDSKNELHNLIVDCMLIRLTPTDTTCSMQIVGSETRFK